LRTSETHTASRKLGAWKTAASGSKYGNVDAIVHGATKNHGGDEAFTRISSQEEMTKTRSSACQAQQKIENGEGVL